MSDLPVVSLGLPVYNGGDLLSISIDSILAQDFKNFELIICDNASDDGTQQLCEGYAAADPRISYHRFPENIGAAQNYNRAFELSSGKYFKWVTHDDLILPGFLTRCVEALEAGGGNVSVVHPGAQFIDGRGDILGPHSDRMHTTAGHPAVRVFQVLQEMNMMSSVFGLFDRSILAQTQRIGSFVGSDYALMLEAALLGEVHYIGGEPLYQRRLHDKMSRQANKSAEDALNWFDPKAKGSRLSTRQRLRVEYLRSARSVGDLSYIERALSWVAVILGMGYKRARVLAGRWKRRLIGSAAPQMFR